MSARERSVRPRNRKKKQYNPNIAHFFEFEIHELQQLFETEEEVDFNSLLSEPEIEALNRTGNLRYLL